MRLTEAEEHIVWRRGGPGHDFECRHATMITCAMWECQVANCCKDDPRWAEAYLAGRAALEATRPDGGRDD